jgi:hypothetical protein
MHYNSHNPQTYVVYLYLHQYTYDTRKAGTSLRAVPADDKFRHPLPIVKSSSTLAKLRHN